MRAHMFGVVLVGLILMGGNCSRARVESMNEMNAGVELAQMKRFNEAKSYLDEIREFAQPNVRLDEPVVTFSPKPPSEGQLVNLPYKQKNILEVLVKDDWLTPAALADIIGIKNYKSRSHAIRSINNILHRLMLEGYVQRESRGKAYMYALTPKVRTLFVEK